MFRKMEVYRTVAGLLGVTALVLGAAQASAKVTVERKDVVGQGMAGQVVAVNGAKLIRSDTGLTASIRIPRPQMNSYIYPGANAFNPAAEPGHPEVFSFWVFVFNYPEDCSSDDGDDGCGLADFGAGRGAAAAFNVGGHVVGKAPILQLSGHISLNSEPFLPPGGRLIEPSTAEVHFAIAPHGKLVPEFMPGQIQTPIGSIDQWWLAIF